MLRKSVLVLVKSILLSALLLVLAGCGGEEPRVYDVPKEDSAEKSVADANTTSGAPMAEAPNPGATAAPMQGDMASRTLPDSALNTSDGNPQWTVPEGWEAGRASSMRRGSYSATSAGGTADIAVTSFPGDVGGMLANINRWRGQIGLAPIGPSELNNVLVEIDANGTQGTLVDFSSETQRTLAATFMIGGNSWFFKMTGPVDTVTAERDAFMRFVESVDFSNLSR